MLKQCIFIYLYLFFGVISNFKRINYICKRTWRDVWRWIQKKWHLFLETEKCHKLTFRYSKKIWQFVFSSLNANLLIILSSPDFSVNVFLTHFIIWCNGKKRKKQGIYPCNKKKSFPFLLLLFHKWYTNFTGQIKPTFHYHDEVTHISLKKKEIKQFQT